MSDWMQWMFLLGWLASDIPEQHWRTALMAAESFVAEGLGA